MKKYIYILRQLSFTILLTTLSYLGYCQEFSQGVILPIDDQACFTSIPAGLNNIVTAHAGGSPNGFQWQENYGSGWFGLHEGEYKNYRFSHIQPHVGKSVRYRLRTIFSGGHSVYSNEVEIHYGPHPTINLVNVPNTLPATGGWYHYEIEMEGNDCGASLSNDCLSSWVEFTGFPETPPYRIDEDGLHVNIPANLGADIRTGTITIMEKFTDQQHTIEYTQLATPPLPKLNTIKTYTPRVPVTEIPQGYNASYQPAINYYDGLGRHIQTNRYGVSPEGKDIVQHVTYDKFGRPSENWLPISHNAEGAYVPFHQISELAQEQYSDAKPYSLTEYESSPLNRPVKQFGTGENWHDAGRSANTAYKVNTNNEVRKYVVNNDGYLVNSGYYSQGSLAVIETTDEDGHKAWVYQDFLGQTILSRVKDGVKYNDTYYVYDKLNQLTYVLPPLAVEGTGANGYTYKFGQDVVLFYYVYNYKYDYRGRCIEKKLPGNAPIRYTYDWLDRVSSVQDGNMRGEGKYLFTIYDNLGRVKEQVLSYSSSFTYIMEGTDSISRTPTTRIRTVSTNYYDNYGFVQDGNLNYVQKEGFDVRHDNAKGLLTGTKNTIEGMNTVLHSVVYYDKKGQVVQEHRTNHLGGYDHHYYTYNFVGDLMHHLHEHSTQNQIPQSLVQGYLYNYDHAGRLSYIKHYLNYPSWAQILVQNSYDELGRLVGKTYGNDNTSMTYSYNVRGWLTEATGPHFRQQLYYNTKPENVTEGQVNYNGNISAMLWQTNDNIQRGYTFTYDNLSRLTHARYGEGSNLSQNVGRYNEELMYDAHGNPQELTRWGIVDKLGGVDTYGVIDDLTYSYGGNRIITIEDEVDILTYYGASDFAPGGRGSSYQYDHDANGNITTDINKGIVNMEYDFQNKPRVVDFDLEHNLEYFYSSSGEKLRVISMANANVNTNPISGIGERVLGNAQYVTTVTDYVGNIVYKYGELYMILLPDGYIDDGYGRYYYVKDHLGNNRVVINDAGQVVQTNHYYAFGMEFGEGNLRSQNDQPYKFGGKESQPMHGLNLYDFHARQYDPATVRFTSPDAYSEYFDSESPYNYALNNPVNNVDPDGNFATWVGAWIYSIFHGGGDVQRDKGGEYFIAQKVQHDSDEAGITVKRTFDWSGRSEGRDLAHEEARDAYITNQNWIATLDQMGVEHTTTDNIWEARLNMVGLSTTVLLPNFIKFASIRSNAVKSTPVTKNSIIDGYRVSNHAWRKGGRGRGATEELVKETVKGAKKSGNITIESGKGQFSGNMIKTYEYEGVIVVRDETRKQIITIRPVKGFGFN